MASKYVIDGEEQPRSPEVVAEQYVSNANLGLYTDPETGEQEVSVSAESTPDTRGVDYSLEIDATDQRTVRIPEKTEGQVVLREGHAGYIDRLSVPEYDDVRISVNILTEF